MTRTFPRIEPSINPGAVQMAEDVFGKHGVVEILLSRVPSQVLDISGGIPGLPPNAMLSNWARKYQEVLIQDWIPPEAIIGRIL